MIFDFWFLLFYCFIVLLFYCFIVLFVLFVLLFNMNLIFRRCHTRLLQMSSNLTIRNRARYANIYRSVSNALFTRLFSLYNGYIYMMLSRDFFFLVIYPLKTHFLLVFSHFITDKYFWPIEWFLIFFLLISFLWLCIYYVYRECELRGAHGWVYDLVDARRHEEDVRIRQSLFSYFHPRRSLRRQYVSTTYPKIIKFHTSKIFQKLLYTKIILFQKIFEVFWKYIIVSCLSVIKPDLTDDLVFSNGTSFVCTRQKIGAVGGGRIQRVHLRVWSNRQWKDLHHDGASRQHGPHAQSLQRDLSSG